ncbi:MAG: hypothetical protein NT096_00955 [Proteobacteria bacterium]|nr:hypothetical protein [Pseudomonadota bacterium]
MYLTAMTHRDELFNLTLRWLNDEFDPGDGENITKIFIFESGISSVVTERILQLLRSFFESPLHMARVRSKHELREHIIAKLGIHAPRFNELADSFRRNPEYFFPRLPIDATVVTDSKSRLVAIARIKRLTRVAEKVSFRLVETFFKEIQKAARDIAHQRATAAGLSLDEFVSSEEAMQSDFIQAEDALVQSLMNKQIHFEENTLAINDILGFKIIVSPEMLDRFQQMLNDEPEITITEVQRHCGNYNAVNLLLDIDLPPADILSARLANMDWNIAGQRGLDPIAIRSEIPEYVSSGAGTIRIEIILVTPEELMEAEFGRSIHELRVLRLRQRQAYCGPLGQNAGYLIEYLLALASSPTVSISEIPIKLYGRYLPEEIAAMKCALHGNSVDGGLLSTFCLQQDCRGHFCLTNSINDFSEHKIA